MTDRIEPALSPKDWGDVKLRETVRVEAWLDRWRAETKPDGTHDFVYDGKRLEKLVQIIAVMNFEMRDSDQRKITEAMVRDIRETAHLARAALTREYGPEEGWGRVPTTLAAMADRTAIHAEALAAYLPKPGVR